MLTHLARRHRVTLITSRAWEGQRLTASFPWLPEGVEMRAAGIAYGNQMGVPRRLLAFGQYAAFALREGMRIERPDVVWGISTPLTAAWAAAQVARRRRVPWVFEVQDLWPSFPIAMGAVPTAWARQRLYALEKGLYQSAAHILPLSPDMTSYVAGLGIADSKITTVLNGTDLDLAAQVTTGAVTQLRQEHGLDGKRIVLYAGTFGRANDIPTLVKAAELQTSSNPDTVWLFMGHGYFEPLIREAAARTSGIRLVAPRPRHEVFRWFALADVSVVSFLDLPVLDANSPAKLYDSLAMGTPVVVTNQGWTKKLVEENQCGWFVPAGQPEQLAYRLTEQLSDPLALLAAGKRGRQLAFNEFDRTQIAEVIEQVLLDVAQ
nr:glycosyltransferase family 4 protein [Hymenobacter translucens]